MSSPPCIALIGCGNRGREVYGAWLRAHPECGKVVAIAEPNPTRRVAAQREHDVPSDRCFSDAASLLREARLAHAAIIATPDSDHVATAVDALEQGYHLLLEKPVATDVAGLDQLAEAAQRAEKRAGLSVTVAHVLRYTPFFEAAEAVLRRGEIGTPRLLQHEEQIGHWHFAHSFVRGNWRRQDEAAPMLLAKACHDLDILLWVAQRSPRSVLSTGSLSWFHRGNLPDGAPPRCTDGCPVEDSCAYSAPRIYLERFQAAPSWPATALCESPDPEAVLQALKHGPYGRCVYRCDNDVADQQGVHLEFPGGLRVELSVSAFTEASTRTIRWMGTQGVLEGDLTARQLFRTDFLDRQRHAVPLTGDSSGHHGGGDHGLMKDFTARLRKRLAGEAVDEARSALKESLESHRLAFLAEQSRIAGGSPQLVPDERELSKR